MQIAQLMPTYATFDSVFSISGGCSGGATPDSIPNSVVKSSSADGTARVTWWESRSLPESFIALTPSGVGAFFLLFARLVRATTPSTSVY